MATQEGEREAKQPVLKEEVQKVLRAQEIDENQPGTILRDFATLLEFVGEEGLKTTSKYFFLPQSQLDELNERMCQPVVHRLKRPQQRSFPHLNGLFLLLRASGLGIGERGRLKLDPELHAAWNRLNPTEQYFCLLESWLIYGTDDILAEGRSWPGSCFREMLTSFSHLDQRKTIVSNDRYGGGIWFGTLRIMSLALMEMFGWLQIEYGAPEDGKGVRATGIDRLPLGDAMADALKEFNRTNGTLFIRDDIAVDPGILKGLFEPLFPQWQQLLMKSELPFREGVHQWRVSLWKAWRKIIAPAELPLDDLALCILDAFDFDCDHLYCFELADRYGRRLRIACPYENDAAAWTDAVCLGELPLAEGAEMTFHFDYGDDWRFTVKLEKIGPVDPKCNGPKVTEKKGDPPPQYGSEDDWDDDWDAESDDDTDDD